MQSRIFLITLLSLASIACFSTELTISDCVAKALENSVEASQNLLNQHQAQASYDQARQARLPQLYGQVNGLTSNDIPNQATDSNKAVLRVEQQSFLFGPDWQLAHQKLLDLESARFSKMQGDQDLGETVKDLYFSILRDADILKSLSQVGEQAKELADYLMPRYQPGVKTPFDRVKIKSVILDINRQQETLRNQIEAEKTQLALMLGLGPNEKLELKPIATAPALPDGIKSDADFFDSNASLKSLKSQLDGAESSVTTARAGYLPTMGLAFEYGKIGSTFDNMNEGWNATAQLKIPLFNWGANASQVDQALASTQLAKRKLESEKQKVNADLEQTERQARAHLDDYKNLSRLLPEIRQNIRESVASYKRASIGVIEVTDALDVWQQNIVNERTAFFNYLGDLAHLEKLSGEKVLIKYE